VRALRRLGAVDVAVFQEMLTDPSPAVTHQVARELRGHLGALDRDRLFGLLESGAPHVSAAVFRPLVASGGWTRLLADLQTPAHNVGARADLTTWLRFEAATTYATPPAEVVRALREAEHALNAETVRVLWFHLSGGTPQ
jgi:hypothetical protein